MASRAHDQRAENAIAHLERSGAAVQSVSGDPREIDHQAALLSEWARANGLLFSVQDLGPLKSQGAEHEVYFRPQDDRAVKRTYPGTFGVTPDAKGNQRAATPLFYLLRLRLMNEVFSSDLRLEGVAYGKPMIIGQTGDQPCLIISQPWARALDIDNPHPSQEEINDFMESLGFESEPNAYFGWNRKSDGIIVLDARKDNFVKAKDGVVPVDLVINQQNAAA